jgi:hypothetical protein
MLATLGDDIAEEETNMPEPVFVRLSDEEIEECERMVREMREHYTTGEKMQIMPWSRDQLSIDELREWLESRKEAGSKIDIATCEISWWYAETLDPYGIWQELDEFDEEYSCVGRERFARSPESNGWVSIGDLPKEKIRAFHMRTSLEYRRRHEAKEAAEKEGITVTFCTVCGQDLFDGEHRGDLERRCRELSEKIGRKREKPGSK